MLFTSHLVVGAVLGRLLPAHVAGLVGVASHLVMDAMPHWGCSDPDAFLKVARVDGLSGLAVSAAVLATAERSLRLPIAAGVVGAGILDMDKPCRHFFGRSPFPATVDAFHERIQEGAEAPKRWPMDAATALGALGVLCLLRRR